MIVVGVDAHSQTHTAAAVNAATGEQIAVREVRAREAGHLALLEWAQQHGGERTWALEDCRNLSGRAGAGAAGGRRTGAQGAAEADGVCTQDVTVVREV